MRLLRFAHNDERIVRFPNIRGHDAIRAHFEL
jgi:hypothetical protein